MMNWLKLVNLFLMGLFLIGSLLIEIPLAAQDDAELEIDSEEVKSKYQYPSVRANIGSLANPLHGGVGFSFDLPLAKRWFFELELGPIWHGQFLEYKEERHLGFRTQGSLRYYLNMSYDGDLLGYIKGVFKYNKVKSIRYFTTLSLDGNFRKDQLVEGDFETYGPSLHIGNIDLLGKNNRFFVDYSVGLGLIFWNYPLELPVGFELMEENANLFGANTSGTFLDLMCTFKIGMFLGKGKG